MKILTVCQPYAELIARGEKPIENRTWFTFYRGPIVIHAGASKTWCSHDDLIEYDAMAFGAVVAVARLIDVVRVDKLPAELSGNEHANGPWCWILTDVQRLKEPIAHKGAQGLRDAPPSLVMRLTQVQSA